jgi:phosphoglycerol transferase MdoB-like AlkP superfamily enzyme
VVKKPDDLPLLFAILYWVVVAIGLHSVFLVIAFLATVLPLSFSSSWLVLLLTYLFSVSVPLFVFYVLIFSDGDTGRTTSIALILCLVVLVPVFYAVFYYAANCFAAAYASFGDSLFFSFLTFSTLGYGDYGIKNECKPIAAGQSIYGLLVVAGIVSLAARPGKHGKPRDPSS